MFVLDNAYFKQNLQFVADLYIYNFIFLIQIFLMLTYYLYTYRKIIFFFFLFFEQKRDIKYLNIIVN